jgi:hypothetical protein
VSGAAPVSSSRHDAAACVSARARTSVDDCASSTARQHDGRASLYSATSTVHGASTGIVNENGAWECESESAPQLVEEEVVT